MATDTDQYGSGAQSATGYRLRATGHDAITLVCVSIALATRSITLATNATANATQPILSQSDRPITGANQAITHPHATPTHVSQRTRFQADAPTLGGNPAAAPLESITASRRGVAQQKFPAPYTLNPTRCLFYQSTLAAN